MTQWFTPRFTCLPASYVLVVAIHPLEGSRANRHHTPNPQSSAAQQTQDGDPQATSNPLEYLLALRREKVKNPSQSPWSELETSATDEDMTPSDTTIDYKVCSFLYLHSNFGYNSLGSTCICHYLNVGTNVSQSVSPSKLNFRFVSNPIVLHWEGHNSSIRSAIEVNEHLIESLFDKISNRSGSTSISHWQDLQIIETFCRYFCRVLRHRRGLDIHAWDPDPSWSTNQEDGEHLRDAQGCPPPWPPP
jgi:hypothetical protein